MGNTWYYLEVPMQTLTVKLPETLVEKLEYYAELNERSKSYYVRKALAQLLEDLEDVRIAEERLANEKELIPFSEIIKKNGLDN
jgi:predicted DNA-binding protein